MNKALTTMMMAAFSVTCITAAAQTQQPADLVIWEGSHDLSGWNKLAIRADKDMDGALSKFLNGENISSEWSYYLEVYNGDSKPDRLQIGTNYGSWDENDEYVEYDHTTKLGELDRVTWSFNPLRHDDWGYDDILITNELVYELTHGRNLQFNWSEGTITKVQIVAREKVVMPDAEIVSSRSVFSFTKPISENVEATDWDPTMGNEFSYWQSGNYSYTLKLTAEFLTGLGFKEGDLIGFNYNYWGDSNVSVKISGTETYIANHLADRNKKFELSADAIASGIEVQGQWINIREIYAIGTVDIEDPKKVIDLFIPGTYPAGFDWNKTEFGCKGGKTQFGTGIINVNAPVVAYGQTSAPVYSFFDEWWDDNSKHEDDLTDGEYSGEYEDYYDNWIQANGNDYIKNSRQRTFGERTSWPLELRNYEIKDLSKVDLGDKIVVSVSPRGLDKVIVEDKDNNKEATKFECQIQLGTYDPSAMDPENPHAGFYEIMLQKGLQPNADGSPVLLEFDVDRQLIEFITRYGLTINGRFCDINWIKAIIAEENKETTEYTRKEYFYNVAVKGNPGSTEVIANNGNTGDIKVPDNFKDDGLLVLAFLPDEKYNEVVTDYYEDADCKIWKNSISSFDDEGDSSNDPEFKKTIDNTVFEVAVKYYDEGTGRWERIHTEYTLLDDHFKVLPAASGAPLRAAGDYDSTESFVDGVESALSYNLNGNKILVLNVKDDSDLKNSIRKNGLEVRGKLYKLSTDNIYTGIEDLAEGDNDAPVEIYTLQGIRVSEMTPGSVYIVKQGNKVNKV